MKRYLCLLLLTAVGAFLVPMSAARTSRPALQVICAVEYGNPGKGAYRTRPHECMFHKRFTPVAYANMVILRSIHWKHWGPKVAVGNGDFLANMAGPTPGTVRLTHPIEVCGHTVFTVAHFKFKGLGSSGHGLNLDRQLNGC